jgi:hypothetical protein
MSWYNENLQNGFIDTTQEFVGGGGGETGGGEEVEDGGGRNGVRQHRGPRDFLVNLLILF